MRLIAVVIVVVLEDGIRSRSASQHRCSAILGVAAGSRRG